MRMSGSMMSYEGSETHMPLFDFFTITIMLICLRGGLGQRHLRIRALGSLDRVETLVQLTHSRRGLGLKLKFIEQIEVSSECMLDW
jgi:hypothetical protein